MKMKESPGDLAGSEDLEHERQAVRDELLCVLLLLDAAEVFEQALDQRPAVLDEAGTQGLEPGVQCPGNTWEYHHTNSEYTLVHGKADLRQSSFRGERTDHVSITLWCLCELKGDCMVSVGLVESRRLRQEYKDNT